MSENWNCSQVTIAIIRGIVQEHCPAPTIRTAAGLAAVGLPGIRVLQVVQVLHACVLVWLLLLLPTHQASS